MRGHRLIVVGAALLLAACQSADTQKTATRITLPQLAAGTHDLVVSGDPDASQGPAFIGNSGGGYIALDTDSNQPAAVVYERSSSGDGWQRVPASASSSSRSLHIETQLDDLMPVTNPPVSSTLEGAYQALIDGSVAAFSISASGKIASTDSSACQLNGQVLQKQTLASALRVTAQLVDCGKSNGDYHGVLFVDPDAANAAFRVIGNNGSAIFDFFAFRSAD